MTVRAPCQLKRRKTPARAAAVAAPMAARPSRSQGHTTPAFRGHVAASSFDAASRRRTLARRPKSVAGSPRNGAATLIVLVMLLVIATFTIALFQLAVYRSRDTGRQAARAQAYWVADAAFNRAAYRLEREPSYQGERWEPLLSADRSPAWLAEITVSSPKPQTQGKVVTVRVFERSARKETPLLTRSIRWSPSDIDVASDPPPEAGESRYDKLGS